MPANILQNSELFKDTYPMPVGLHVKIRTFWRLWTSEAQLRTIIIGMNQRENVDTQLTIGKLRIKLLHFGKNR